MNDLVSVILPTYNRAFTIGRAVRSVLNQTYKNLELIIIDDESTDNTQEIVKSFKDGRIVYSRHDKNKGCAAARNTGILLAKGQYVAFQDSDDEWFVDKLQIQMQYFEKVSPKIGVVYSAFFFLKNNKKFYIPGRKIKQRDGNIHKSLLSGNFVTTQASVIRKECFAVVGMFDETIPRMQDWEFFLRFSRKFEFKFVEKPLLNVYLQNDSISMSNKKLIVALELILIKHYDVFYCYSRRNLSNIYWWLANLLYTEKEFDRSYKIYTKALKIFPHDLKHWVVFFLKFILQRRRR